jgi:sirohydrochlorin ferrochelatase
VTSSPPSVGGSHTAWLLVAHGSRNPDLAAAHAQVCDAIAAEVGTRVSVRAAYLELTEPSIPEAVEAAVTDGADLVVLVPYFLHVGNHTLRDLPAILEAARDRHPRVRFSLADHLGFDDRLVAVAIDRAVAAEESSGSETGR